MVTRKEPEKPIPKLFGLQPPRRQKKFTELLALKIERQFFRKTPAQYVEEMHAKVSAAFRNELASVFAAAMLAKKTLDATRQVDMPFPDRYFDGTATVDEAARAELMAYGKALEKFDERCMDDETPLSTATSLGLGSWIPSVYALARPELKPKVSESWVRMVQTDLNLDEAYRMLLRRDPSDVDRVYFQYRPKVFLD